MHVTGLTYYPVKSCKGIRLTKAKLTESGIENDRRWIVIKDNDVEPKEMLTQREEPKMVTITPSVYGSDELTLEAPGMPIITVDFAVGELVLVKVWDDVTRGHDQGSKVSEWLSLYLGQPVRLVARDFDYTRSLPPKHTPMMENFDFEPQISFADGYPLLLLSSNSVKEFQSHCDLANVENFRPNITIEADAPYQEDEFVEFNINDIPFFGGMLCTRCIMTNNNPETGVPHPNVLKALTKYRRIDPGAKYQACMGINVVHGRIGTIQVGDEITITKTGKHNRKTGIWRP